MFTKDVQDWIDAQGNPKKCAELFGKLVNNVQLKESRGKLVDTTMENESNADKDTNTIILRRSAHRVNVEFKYSKPYNKDK